MTDRQTETQIDTHTHMHTHIHIHTHIYTHTHTYIYTETRKFNEEKKKTEKNKISLTIFFRSARAAFTGNFIGQNGKVGASDFLKFDSGDWTGEIDNCFAEIRLKPFWA